MAIKFSELGKVVEGLVVKHSFNHVVRGTEVFVKVSRLQVLDQMPEFMS